VKLRNESGSVITAGLLTGTEPVIVRLSPAVNGAAEAVALPAGFRIRTIHAVPEPPDSFLGIETILVRPDGYIAWAGNNDAELSRAIEEWFGMSVMVR